MNQIPWVIWVGLAMVGGVGLRFVKLPEFMLPVVVGLAVAGAMVLVLRVVLNPGEQPLPLPRRRAPGRPMEKRTAGVPAPSRGNLQGPGKKDPGARLANLANRAAAARRDPGSH